MIEIKSDTIIDPDISFKVTAGPGAGKTHWLINHIQNVLQKSIVLNSTSKIACITYTNIAVDEIKRRLSNNGDKVYVSTIHNFLYKYIIKPYGFLLLDDSGKNIINLKELDGHDEHIPNGKFIYDWKNLNRLHYIKDEKKIFECLQDLDWIFDTDMELKLGPRHDYKRKIGKYWIKKELFNNYKSFYWRVGLIHHEDVLYFAYKIIKENPEIINYLRFLFPFIFIDEFQDTNPIQTKIVQLLAEEKMAIGIIGDSEQSIYKFQGASCKDFIDFSLPNLQYFQINGNRRSPYSIIRILNHFRQDDLEQQCIKGVSGNNPKIYIGDKNVIINDLMERYPNITILTRNNETVGQIKNKNDNKVGSIWDNSRNQDSNYERQRLLYNSIYASELCLAGLYKEAIRKISKLLYKYEDGNKIAKHKKRDISISIIDYLVSTKDYNLSKTIFDYCNELYNYLIVNYKIKIGAKITGGRYKDFSSTNKYSDLVQALKINDDPSNVKTIHKAKGTEYENVVVFIDNNDLKYIIEPSKYSDEDDSRIYYVAFSRAKEKLFIIIPSKPTDQEMEKLKMIGFDIEFHNT